MSWTNGAFSQDDSIMNGYPYPNQAVSATIPFDMEQLYIAFIFDPEGVLYPRPTTYPIPFDIRQVYTKLFVNPDVNFGYASPITFDPPRLGAFASTTNLETVNISASVISLGKYTFDKSGVSTVTIAPDCYFYVESTFPKNCEVSYYTTTLVLRSVFAKWEYIPELFKYDWVEADPIVLFNTNDIASYCNVWAHIEDGKEYVRDITEKCSFNTGEEEGTIHRCTSSLTTCDEELTITSNGVNWTEVQTDWIMEGTEYSGFPHAYGAQIFELPEEGDI